MSQSTSRSDATRGRHAPAGLAAPQTPPTLATVADEAGVSRQTVSNALNNPELLRPDTLARVQAVIERARLLARTGRPASCARAPRT